MWQYVLYDIKPSIGIKLPLREYVHEDTWQCPLLDHSQFYFIAQGIQCVLLGDCHGS